MRHCFVCFFALAGSFAAGSALAQTTNNDAILSINGQTLETDAATVYFNAENCTSPADTTYELRLANGDGVSQAFMWAGTQNSNCQNNSNRTDQQNLCRVMADSNPRTVGDNATITGLTLQELVNTGIVDCQNTALEGANYEIYSFRNEDPGGNDVPPEGFGVAPFTVDVTPPAELNVTSPPEQTGSTFSVAYDAPVDSLSIAQYRLYANPTDDPSAAQAAGPVATGDINARSLSVAASALGLAPGEETFLYVSAVDMASVVLGEGNEGPLSVPTLGIAAQTSGFCDDPSVDCSGCSAAPLMTPAGQLGGGLQLLAFVFAVVAAWRLRR